MDLFSTCEQYVVLHLCESVFFHVLYKHLMKQHDNINAHDQQAEGLLNLFFDYLSD